MTNIFLIKNISYRAPMIIGVAVGGVFLLASVFLAFKIFWSDTLIGYAPVDTSFYVHVRTSKLMKNPSSIQLINKIASDNNIIGINFDEIKEVAVVGSLKNDVVRVSLLIKSKNQTSLESFLIDRGISYKHSSNGKIIIIDPSDVINVDGYKDGLSLPLRSRYSIFGLADAYVAGDFVGQFDKCPWGVMASLFTADDGNIYSHVTAKKGEILIAPLGVRGKKSAHGLRSREDDNFDLVFSATDAKFLAEAGSVCPEMDISHPEIAVARDFLRQLQDDSKALAMVKKNEVNTGWVFSDYDVLVAFDGLVGIPAVEKLELAVKTAVANKFPTPKSVYLSDGTRVVDLRRDPGSFNFIQDNNLKSLTVPDKTVAFSYASQNDRLVVANKVELMSVPAVFRGDYLYLKTSWLPETGFWQYAKVFNAIEVDGGGVWLK